MSCSNTIQFNNDTCEFIKTNLSTGYDYMEETDNDVLVREIMQFMEQLFPCRIKRENAWKLLSSFICTGDKNELHIWYGTGGNGKTTLSRLLQETFGDYSLNVPHFILTGEKQVMPNTEDKKAIFISESESCKISADILFSNLHPKINCNAVLCCNVLPEVEESDKYKVHILEFDSKFSGTDFSDKIERWSKSGIFMRMLIDCYIMHDREQFN